MLTAIFSFIMSGLLILFSFLAFTPVINALQFLKLFFACLVIKAFMWSPFIALEFYDTCFENVYYDVQWQLNPIEPGTAKKVLSKRVMSGWDLDDFSSSAGAAVE